MTQRAAGAADEAAKLLGALERWLRAAADGQPGSASEAGTTSAGRPGGVVRDLFAMSEHSHERTSACDICPLCRAITAVRAARPDIVDHLVDAAGSVLLALRALAEPAANSSSSPAEESAETQTTVVQHITVN